METIRDNYCRELLEKALQVKDEEGKLIMFEIDRQLQNIPEFNEKINMEVPKFISSLIDGTEKNGNGNPVLLIRSICQEIENIEDKININVKEKPSLIIRRSLYKMFHRKCKSKIDEEKRSSLSEIEAKPEFKKSKTPKLTIKTNSNNEIYKLYNEIAAKTDNKGNLMIKKFYRRPSHSSDSNEILCLSIIRKNIIKKKYANVKELAQELRILFSKAIDDNHPRSTKHICAKSLNGLVDETLNKIGNKGRKNRKRRHSKSYIKEDSENKSLDSKVHSNKYPRITQLLHKIYNIRRKNDSGFAYESMESINYKKDCQIYNKEVEDQKDLQTIAKNVHNNCYNAIKDLIEDISIVVANVRYLYPKTSKIYLDSLDIERAAVKEISFQFTKMVRANLAKISNEKVDNSMTNEYDRILDFLSDRIDSYDDKYLSLSKLKNTLLPVKSTMEKFETYSDFFDVVAETFISYAEKNKTDKRLYNSLLKIVSDFVVEFYIICPQIQISFHVDSKIIIQSIFDKLSTLKDEYGVNCLTSISKTVVREFFSLNHDSHVRSYDLNSIKDAVILGQYRRVVCFVNDLVTLFRTVRIKFYKFSEPYIHADILYKFLMGIVLSIKPHKYKCDLIINWDDFYNKNIGVTPSGENSQNFITVPEICPEFVFDEYNFTGEAFSYSPDLLFSKVQYKNDVFIYGDFVRVGIEGSVSSCNQKIAMVRKFYVLPSGKKAFIGHVLINGQNIELMYERCFNVNELVMLKDFYCFRVKDIIAKVDIFQSNRFSEIDDRFYFFFYCLYDYQLKLLFPIPKENKSVLSENSLKKMRSSKSMTISCQNKSFYPENFLNLMLLHMYSRLDLFKNYSELVNDQEYFILHKILVRKNDFIKIQDEKNSLFQIKKIKPQLFSYNILHENVIITCRKYVFHEDIDFYSLKPFYSQEYIQTDIYSDISSNKILSIVSVMKEAEYLSFRCTQFPEEKVFICRFKLKDKTLIIPDEFEQNISISSDIMFIKDHNFLKFFNTKDSINIEKIINDDNFKLDHSSDTNFYSHQENNIIIDNNNSSWICHWDKCNTTYPSYLSLIKHFFLIHFGQISDNFNNFFHIGIENHQPPQSYSCRWIDCKYTENISSAKSCENLLRHVRDVHCKNSYREAQQKTMRKSTFSENVEDRNIGSQIILMRDPFVECLLNIIDKRCQNIDEETSKLINYSLKSNPISNNGSRKKNYIEKDKQDSNIFSNSSLIESNSEKKSHDELDI